MAPRGEKNGNWGGDGVGYKGIHKWVRRNKPLTGKCQKCGRTNRKTEHACIDHSYTRDLKGGWKYAAIAIERWMGLTKELLKLEKLHE